MDYISLVKALFSVLTILSCIYCYTKTDALYTLSSHRGIKAFRDAFAFFGFAFLINILIVMLPNSDANLVVSLIILHIIFSYLISMGGFSLVYSLLWKDLGWDWIYALHAVSIALALIEFFYIKNIVYLTQLFVMAYGIIVSYSSYRAAPDHNFRQLYFICMVLAFLGYGINFIGYFLSAAFPYFWVLTYIVTTAAFWILGLGVSRSIRG